MHAVARMSAEHKTLTDLAKSAADRLSGLVTEAELQLHLAGMEAKEAWRHVGPDVTTLRTKLQTMVDEAASGKAGLELHLGLAEARDRWRAIGPKAKEVAGEAAERIEKAFAEITAALDKPKKDPPRPDTHPR